MIKGGIVSASCTAELGCWPGPARQPVPTPVTAGAVEPGLSKLLINDILQFSGLDPSKKLTVQIALEKFRSDHGAGEDVELFPFSWVQCALPALGG